MVRNTCLASVLAAAVLSAPAYAQTDFPSRRIHVVVPYPAGGIVDIATSQHLNTALFLNATRLSMMAVPYPGQPPAIVDLMANRVQFKVAAIGLVAQHINSGALKPLAVLGATRSPLLPNVPTVSEA